MLIGLMGKIGSGKTALAKVLHSEYRFEHHAFGNALKDMLVKAGMVTKKDLYEKPPLTRWLLQKVATDIIRNQVDPDFWVKKIQEKICPIGKRDIVVDDVRFPNEAQLIWDLGGYVIKIFRPDREAPKENAGNHISELLMDEIEPNGTITNGQTIDKLNERFWELIKILKGEEW